MENSAPYLEIGCPHCGRVNRVPTERLEQGPSCGHCKAAIESAVATLAGVRSVVVDVDDKSVVVEGDVPDGVVIDAIVEAGYDVVEPACE